MQIDEITFTEFHELYTLVLAPCSEESLAFWGHFVHSDDEFQTGEPCRILEEIRYVI